MTFEKIVKEYERIKSQFRRLEGREREVRATNGLPSGGNDGMPKAKTNSSSVENTVVRLTQILDEKKKVSFKLEKKRQEIMSLINRVSSCFAQEIIEIKTFNWYEIYKLELEEENRKLSPQLRKKILSEWEYIHSRVFLSVHRCQHLYYDGIKEINDYLKQEKSL